MGALNDWFAEYKARADFVVVYVKEAHTADGKQAPSNKWEGIVYDAPQTFEERKEIARACEVGLALKIPLVIDKMDNAVERAYMGWPDRVYIIGKDGRVAYVGRPGPAGFKPMEAKPILAAMLDSSA